MIHRNRRALILIIAIFALLIPLAVSQFNREVDLSGAALNPNREQSETTPEAAPPDAPADGAALAQADDPEPTAVPATEVPPTSAPPTAVPPTNVPPTAVPENTEQPATQPEATAEATEAPITAPEITPEPEVGVEATAELTPEATAEATDEPSALEVSATCTNLGVQFVISNPGEAMAAAAPVLVDAVQVGEIQLLAGETMTVDAGFGVPRLTFLGTDYALQTPCIPPAELSIAAECTLEFGVIFTLTNTGGAMSAEAEYTLSFPEGQGDAQTTPFQLDAGEALEIRAGFGLPTFSSGDLLLTLDDTCDPPSTIEGMVWLDTNADGINDPTEVGIPGVVVLLINPEGFVVEAITGEDGRYQFINVTAETYTVQIKAETLPDELALSFDADAGEDALVMLDVAAGEVYTLDFGYAPDGTGVISGIVWLELGDFGTREAGEPGLTDVTVELLDGAGAVIAMTVVDVAGVYRFEDLRAGEYTVRIVAETLPQPHGVTFDMDGSRDTQTTLTLERGQTLENINFGIVGAF